MKTHDEVDHEEDRVTNTPWSGFKKICAYIFCTLEDEHFSMIAKVLDFATKLVVVLAVVVTIIEVEPSFLHQPEICEKPTCEDDPILCPGRMVCEPEVNHKFHYIENVRRQLPTRQRGCLNKSVVQSLISHISSLITLLYPSTP
jgi:hypothetical protein